MRAEPAAIAEAIKAARSGRHLLLLCDFDGTLAEFDSNPAAVQLIAARREILERFSSDPASTVGIVSGRRLADVRARLGIAAPIYVAGLHGLEIEGEGEHFQHPGSASARELVHRLAALLQPRIAGVPGVFIEDKELSMVLHYRDAPPVHHAAVVSSFLDVTRDATRLGQARVLHGACMVELLPNIPWDKGRAVEWIIDRVQARHGPAWPVYFGDDVTDEDAFRALRGRGTGVAASDRVTGGDFRVYGPADVERVLRALGGC